MTVLSQIQVPRRTVSTALAATPFAALLADAGLVRAAADSLHSVSITTAGGRSVSGAVALPEAKTAPTVALIHEWWGLNDQIKAVAAQLAAAGHVALTVDLYDGQTADDPDQARALMQAVDAEAATDTMVSWAEWLRAHERGNGTVGTCGWCFGGGWSLSTAVNTKIDACVIYYGRVDHPQPEIDRLQGPVLGHFATRDGWITGEMVEGFRTRLEAAGTAHDLHWYEADHAFANPTRDIYDEDAANLAWQRTMAFFAANLAG